MASIGYSCQAGWKAFPQSRTFLMSLSRRPWSTGTESSSWHWCLLGRDNFCHCRWPSNESWRWRCIAGLSWKQSVPWAGKFVVLVLLYCCSWLCHVYGWERRVSGPTGKNVIHAGSLLLGDWELLICSPASSAKLPCVVTGNPFWSREEMNLPGISSVVGWVLGNAGWPYSVVWRALGRMGHLKLPLSCSSSSRFCTVCFSLSTCQNSPLAVFHVISRICSCAMWKGTGTDKSTPFWLEWKSSMIF